MDWKVTATVFGSVFLAELGDKTQLATMLFAANREVSKWSVFLGSALALVVASGLGVLVGAALAEHLNERYLNWAAGLCFIGAGVWTLLR